MPRAITAYEQTARGIYIIDLDGNRSMIYGDYMLEIARGNVPGLSSINKFGRNIEIDNNVTADVWDGGNTAADSLIWVAPTQARVHAIVSDSDNDSDSGGVNPQSDGARTIQVFGLIDWDTKEVSEIMAMDGTQSINTVNSYVIIHRIKVLTKGNNAAGPNVGEITATAATDGTITARIRATQGQTQMAIYGIPSIQIAYMIIFYGDVNRAGGAAGLVDFSLLVNPEPDIERINFIIKHTFGLQTVGSSHVGHLFSPYKKIEGPAIIKVQCSSGANDMDISSGFDMILVDN